jgi:transcriptional regulator with XRE-family HTH domain
MGLCSNHHGNHHGNHALMAIPETPGERLAEAIEKSGMSHRELASRLPVSPKQLSLWVNDRAPIPRGRLAQLAELLGVPAGWLRTGAPEGTDGRPGRAAEPEAPYAAPTMPHAPRAFPHRVRIWLAEFQTELTRAGVPEEDIARIMRYLRSPEAIDYFVGGGEEMSEEEIVAEMRGLAEHVRERQATRGRTLRIPEMPE